MSRFLLLPASVALLASPVPPQATSLAQRLGAAEATVAAHYRGEPLDVAREKVNQGIDAYNVRAKTAQAELDAAKARLEQALAPGKALMAKIQALDEQLKELPEGNDKAANARYQARVADRNALAKEANAANAAGQAAVEAYNAQVKTVQDGVAKARAQVQVDRDALNARVAAFNAFAKSGGDLAFFNDLNRLLAEAVKAGDTAAAAKARALRRELGAYAVAAEARKPNGLVILEVKVQDEPAWLVLDTGAADVVVSPELLEAAGVSLLGAEDSTLVVVGGQRLRGRAAKLPRLNAAGQSATDVAATALRPFDVGIDGLLGQSFLKGFVYTVDERKGEKLGLVRR